MQIIARVCSQLILRQKWQFSRLNLHVKFEIVIVMAVVRLQRQVSLHIHVHMPREHLGLALQLTPVYPLLVVYQFCAGLLAVVTLDCDKHFGLFNLGQRRLEGNKTGGIERQVSSSIIESMRGSEYRRGTRWRSWLGDCATSGFDSRWCRWNVSLT
jgi:hypothetical protein